MELTEPIDSINRQLIDLFGIDTITGIPIWRVVWSEDQFEKQYGTYNDYTKSGIFIRTVTEVREIPKYRQWIQEKYVLERLTVVPIINEKDLPDTRVSYEPLYVFEDGKGNYLPPQLVVCKFAIDLVYHAQYGEKLVRYRDPEGTPEQAMELKKQRVDELQKAIFGDETNISDAITRKEGIFVPENYKEKN